MDLVYGGGCQGHEGHSKRPYLSRLHIKIAVIWSRKVNSNLICHPNESCKSLKDASLSDPLQFHYFRCLIIGPTDLEGRDSEWFRYVTSHAISRICD
jgi:hypothetical protein